MVSVDTTIISIFGIMKAESKIFLTLLQFITISLQHYIINVNVYYVTRLYFLYQYQYLLYLHLIFLALQFEIIYSIESRKD